MMKKIFVLKIIVLVMSFFSIASEALFAQTSVKEMRQAERILDKLDEASLFGAWQYMGKMGVDSVSVNGGGKEVSVFLSPNVSYIPVRHAWINNLKAQITEIIGWRFRNYKTNLICRGRSLENYIPLFLSDITDTARMAVPSVRVPLVERAGADDFRKGLKGNHIALWASHGYYYEAGLDRWEWQRARLFETVEDIYPFSFIHNFLTPMLEDAGANVFLPRERDIQINEVIVDNDSSTAGSELVIENSIRPWKKIGRSGFAVTDTLFDGDNPFLKGSHLRMETSVDSSGRLVYVPDIPENGEYAVYISWAHDEKSLDRVPCVVNHSGGNTRFFLNQQMSHSTWVYLGTFHFIAGKDQAKGSVLLESPKMASGVVTADAVRFGGGMGNVARRRSGGYIPKKWSLNDDSRDDIKEEVETDSIDYKYKLSGLPRWMEAGRYYLQYAGMPDSTVYNLNDGKNDYNDDYESRGEWVNYMMGAPNGPTDNPDAPGLNIPIDLAFAFHTDAGVTPDDSVIGTLGIYSTERNEGLFPNGKSKLASRDLTDMIQSQIVTDVRLNFKDDWTRRGMWDRQYSEAWRPNVPTMLLELLSHQNLADMTYGLDPRFQFVVARSVYKGMARFLAAREDREVMIKPLAPDHLSIQRIEGKRIRISWKPVIDPVEKTAIPTGYRVFQRIEDNGFDDGLFTTDTFLVLELPEYETIYSFKVAALNEGGLSFPGETLSVSLQPSHNDMVLIVNGFDRVAPPSFAGGKVAGVTWWEDEGVPWHRWTGHTGNQYDYDRSSPWRDDDSPGHGASFADMEGKIIPGNTFDFVLTHGMAVREAGFSFVSMSDESFEQEDFNAGDYFAVDMIYGEERGTKGMLMSEEIEFRIWTPRMQEAIRKYLETGGNVFVSGAYIGTDMVENNDSTAIEFAEDFLHYKWSTNHADNMGGVEVTDMASDLFLPSLHFNVDYDAGIYKVEAPDGLEPVGNDAFRIFRYSGNKVNSGVAYSGEYRSVVLGFPFETITDEFERTELMKQILTFFRRQK